MLRLAGQEYVCSFRAADKRLGISLARCNTVTWRKAARVPGRTGISFPLTQCPLHDSSLEKPTSLSALCYRDKSSRHLFRKPQLLRALRLVVLCGVQLGSSHCCFMTSCGAPCWLRTHSVLVSFSALGSCCCE